MITINLDLGDTASDLQPEHFLQIEAHKKMVQHLLDSQQRAERARRQESPVGGRGRGTFRFHDAIFIDGARGTGKTAFLLNFFDYLRVSGGEAPEMRALASNIYICQPIDPTLLNDNESFLNIIIARLMDEVRLRATKKFPQTEYYKLLERISQGMAGLEGKDIEPGLDRFSANSHGIGLIEALDAFYAEICKLLGCTLLLLPIDDVDMAPSWAFQVLDVARRYLASPFIIPIITGDMEQYAHIIRRHFNKKLNNQKGREQGSFNPSVNSSFDVDELAEQYLLKVLPTYRRIPLDDIWTINRRTPIVIDDDRGQEMPLVGIMALYKALVFRSVNGFDDSYPTELPTSTRELVQWLLAVGRPILRHAETLLGKGLLDGLRQEMGSKGELSLKLSRDLKRQADGCITNRSSPEVRGALIEIFREIRRYHEGAAGHTARGLRHWVCYYRTEADLALLEHNPPARPMSDIVFFNPVIHPAKHSGVEWYWRAEQPPRTTLVAFPPLEAVDPNLRIMQKSALNRVTDELRVWVALFSEDNYYSDVQGHRYTLFCFGKAFEFLIASLIGDVTVEGLRAILEHPPYHSTLLVPEGRFQLVESATGEAADADEATPSLDETLLGAVVSAINHWRSEHEIPVPSAQLLQRVASQVFDQIASARQLKSLRTLASLIERFRRIVLNAVACFERDRLDPALGPIVRQRVGLGPVETLTPERFKNDNAYLRNIQVLLEQSKTLTYVLNDHPLWIKNQDEQLDLPLDTETEKKQSSIEKARIYLRRIIRLKSNRIKSLLESEYDLDFKNKAEILLNNIYTEILNSNYYEEIKYLIQNGENFLIIPLLQRLAKKYGLNNPFDTLLAP